MDQRAVERYYDLIQRGSLAAQNTSAIAGAAKAALFQVGINIPAIQSRMAIRLISLTFNLNDPGITGFLTCNGLVARINVGSGPSTVRFIPTTFAGQLIGAAGASLYFNEDNIIEGTDYLEFGGVANNQINLNFQADVSNSDAAAHNVTGLAVVLFELYQAKNAALAGKQKQLTVRA
jgi:hypothetical protein